MISPINYNCCTPMPMRLDGSLTDYEYMCKVLAKLNEVVEFVNNLVDGAITDYIEQHFNELMVKNMYVPETETIKFYLEVK